MKGANKIFVLILAIAIAVPVFSVLPNSTADGNGILNTSYTWEGKGGYVAAGVGTWGSSYGIITVSGIPSSSTIERAFIYWVCPSTYGLDTYILLEGNGVTGTQIGRDGVLYGYRADVTSIVSGNGDYEVTDITTSYGASIVVVYSQPASNQTMVIINDGMDTKYNQWLPHWLVGVTFSGFVAPSDPQAYVTLIMGDGQTVYSGRTARDKYSFNGNIIAIDEADGSDGNPTTHGWDTDTYDVSSYISEGDTYATANIYEETDELNWVTCVFSICEGSSSEPLIADAGPDQIVNECDVVQFVANASGGSGGHSFNHTPVALWHMNEGSGNILHDETSNNHDGTIIGATWVDGRFGKALNFDGFNDFVEVLDRASLDITEELTIEAWIKPRRTDYAYMVCKELHAGYPQRGVAYTLDIYPGRVRAAGHMDPMIFYNPTGTTNILYNEWQYLAMTWEGNIAKVFYNGCPEDVINLNGSIKSTDANLAIGRYASLYFDGIIDEVVIYDMGLPDQYFLDYYNSGMEHLGDFSGGAEVEIISYEWDFESDGIFDYQETSSNAPDGIFDGKTSHIYGDNGEYETTLRVTDENGKQATDKCNISVLNLDPILEIESATMEVEIGLRVAGRKFNDVGMILSENEKIVGYVSIERIPGSPDDQMAWIPMTLNLSRTYSAVVTFTPEDPPYIGGNPTWIYIKFPNGSMQKIHHTFNVQQSKKRDSDHWNHVEPWEVDLNMHLIGWSFDLNYHISDPGSDDEIMDCSYCSQNMNINYLCNPPNPDPFPSPEVNPRDIYETTIIVYEGAGTISLQVDDDDGGFVSKIVHLA